MKKRRQVGLYPVVSSRDERRGLICLVQGEKYGEHRHI